jgi:WD40 repeat protein
MCDITIAYAGGNYRNFVGDGAIMRVGVEDKLKRSLPHCLLVLADGRLLMGLGQVYLDDITLCVWDGDNLAGSGRTLKGHTAPVTRLVKLTGDNGLVVSASEDALRVWDMATEACLHVMVGHRSSVTCLAVLGDASVASGSRDKSMRIWNTSTGKCTFVLTTIPTTVHGLVKLGDGRLVIVGINDPRLEVWDPSTGRSTRTVLPDGWSWDMNNRNRLFRDMICVTCVLALANGGVVSGCENGSLLLWDMTTMKCTLTLRGHTGAVGQLVELPDGRVVSGAVDGKMRVWDMNTGACTVTLPRGPSLVGWFECMAVGPDGRVWSVWRDGVIVLWS